MEAIILILIKVAILVLIIHIAFWGLRALGVGIPAQIEKIVWVIVVLLVLLWMLPVILGAVGGSLHFHL